MKQTQMFRIFAGLCLITGLAACAAQPPIERTIQLSQEDLLGGAVFGDVADDRIAAIDTLAVNDDMRAFLSHYVPPDASDHHKVQLILRAILDNGLQLHYNNFKTYTAQEAFYQREGNCLSFTNLFVALAREAGVRTYFQEVDIPPAWEAQGETFLFNLHINAVADLPGDEQVIDFDMALFDLGYGHRRIRDEAALSQYHNNMGVYWLGLKQYPTALLHFREALELQPRSGVAWTNLGTLYRRSGFDEYAEASYLQAIDQSNTPAALSNLSRLYHELGEEELSEYYAGKVQLFRRRNPYYLFSLAEEAYADSEFSEAEVLLRNAIKKRPDEEEFHRLQGLTLLQLGEPDEAQKSFSKAAALVNDPESTKLYAHKLQLLSQRP
jgi:Flp pilus assembly protein TadD